MSDFEAVLRWYLVLSAAGVAGLPVAAVMLGDAAKRAVWFARPLGLMALFLPVWYASSVVNLPFSRLFLTVSLVLVAGAGWLWFFRSGAVRLLSVKEVVIAEGVALLGFIGALWLRGFTPNILNTEKPMDSAFLSSIIRTEHMPPPDPWLAGESINYYYIGYALHGSIARIAGIASPQAFNLALITTTVMALMAAIGAAMVIAPRYAKMAGALAGFFVVISGNMDGPYRVLRQGREAWEASWWAGMGWESSRVVYDGSIQTINEFPVFSIILGDLHPHLIALPFTLVALAVAAGIARNESAIGWPALLLSGVLGGALYGLNSWDLPTYLGLIVLATIWNLRHTGGKSMAVRIVAMIGAALLAWLPFIANFTPFVAGDPSTLPETLQGVPVLETILTTVAINDFEFTSAGEFLRVFGLFYAFVVVALLFAARRLDLKIEGNDRALVVGIPFGLMVLVALLANAPVFILVGTPAILATLILARTGPATTEGMIASLYLAGALIVGLTELFYIQDQFHDRMNTLFKAYYQVWSLWGIATAVSLAWMLGNAPKPAWNVVLRAGVAVSVALGLIYPVVSATRWTNEFEEWQGLDGSAYIARFSDDELAGIAFIRENAAQNSVVLEAPGCSYQPISRIPFSRVSAFTGVPTVLGWFGHEGQWRSGDDVLHGQLGARRDEVQAFYEAPDQAFIDRYGIDFVYVGIYEQGKGQDACEWAIALPEPDLAAMNALGFEIVFQQGDVTIWQRMVQPA